jgi:hypothetical protein
MVGSRSREFVGAPALTSREVTRPDTARHPALTLTLYQRPQHLKKPGRISCYETDGMIRQDCLPAIDAVRSGPARTVRYEIETRP